MREETGNDLRAEILSLTMKSSYQCSVGAWLDTRDDRAEWVAILIDPTLKGAGIWRAMSARGFTNKLPALHRHRRGDCDCDAA